MELKDGELEMDEVEEESGSGNLLDQIAGSIGGGAGKAKAGGGQFKIENIFNPKTFLSVRSALLIKQVGEPWQSFAGQVDH